MKWSTTTIDSIKADSRYSLVGGPFGSNLTTRDYVEEGIPVIRGVNLPEESPFAESDFVFVSEAKADALEPNNAFPGDLIFTQRGTLGQVGLIPLESRFPRYVISQSQMKLTVNPEKADAKFVYYFFRHPNTVQMVKNRAITSGVPHINLGILKEFELPLPPVPTQRRIASVLSTYDDLIENNLRRIALLEEAARLLYREWFVRLRFPGHEHTRIVDGVPEGWHRMELEEVAQEISEQIAPDKVEADTPYIGLEHMPRRSIALSTWGKASEVQSAKHIFKERDVLFGKIRPYFHKVGVCFTDGIASTDAIVIRPCDESVYGLVLMTVSSDEFVAHANQSSYGAKMPRADWKVLKKHSVNVPPPGLRKQFSESINHNISLLKNLTFQNQKLKLARDLLLPRLMRGEIAV